MKLFTIGFTQKTAQEFFEKLKENNVELLLDIRLNNASQLAGFAKDKDLQFFLKTICSCKYEHNLNFAPTKELLTDYRNKKITWLEYEKIFYEIMEGRKIENEFIKYLNYKKVCLLCSEPTATNCHRRLVAEYLANKIKGIEIIHL